MFPGAEIRRLANEILLTFSPILKKSANLKKKKILLEFSFSHHTHMLHGDILLPLHLMAILCVIANLFFN